MEEVKRMARSVLQLYLDEFHCGTQANLHRPTFVDSTLV